MKHLFLLLLFTLPFFGSSARELPKLNFRLKEATVKTEGSQLIISTGKLERIWSLTDAGLLTKSLNDLESGEKYMNEKSPVRVDWAYQGLFSNVSKAELISLNAKKSDDEGFTSDHIEVIAEFNYPNLKASLRYIIWAYPGAPGLRTQLFIKAPSFELERQEMPVSDETELSSGGQVDYVPVDLSGYQIHIAGYFNDTQHRNNPDTPVLREDSMPYTDERIVCYWSNLVRAEKGGNGIALVKESHKCVNQYGVDTGEFLIDQNGITNTGTSLEPTDLSSCEYKWCWASWCILYSGGEDGFEQAVKQFDRSRYPVDSKLDIYTQANTWGSGKNRYGSKEENIIEELESQQDLGIDIQQIDDGWQTEDWKLKSDWYPDGWTKVVAKSKATGVKLGLWAAAMPITLEDLKSQYNAAGFITYKLDFADLGNHQNMEDLIQKVRDFIKYTGHRVRVNWDVTENNPRYGYYWAREYGCVYLENRKPKNPQNVVYIPYLVLRDIWHVSKYTNINKFQTTIQNVDMIDRQLSDAYRYNHPYAVAIGLVGTPLFFQETHFYDDAARDQIRPLLSLYKKYRKDMYAQYVYPIGKEPDNASWTGFQWFDESTYEGFLLIFRELKNKLVENELQLRFLQGSTIRLTDLRSGVNYDKYVDETGMLKMKIDKPASFLFLKYELKK